MVPDLVLRPPAFVLWLATGPRLVLRRWLGIAFAAALLLLAIGPAASAVPFLSGDTPAPLPPTLVGSGLHPTPISGPAAERLLGEPLLDSQLLHRDAQDLGVWSAAINGPYGHTVVIYHVLSTGRRTWLTLLELRSQRPLATSPWDLVVARPTTMRGLPARLYQQPGSTTVAWQEGPTLEASLSEDLQQPGLMRATPAAANLVMLPESRFLALAASLRPRGRQVGPFRLDPPW